MRQLVLRRLTPEGQERFFGKSRKNGLHKLIGASGGQFWDLIRLLRETLLLARSFPVDGRVVELAIADLRDSMLPIPVEDARWLKKIGEKRTPPLEDRSAKNVQTMTLFLDTHCAMIPRNGEIWYDVHPVIRGELDEIVKRNEDKKSRKKKS